MKTYRIFYSWQNDLPKKTNKKFISDILANVAKDIRTEDNININIDEATKDESGTPDIIETIIKKISNADVYVADISIVGSYSDTKKTTNPNVLYELGYAVSRLGWDRIILIFNDQFGKLDDLPFDINKRRISLNYSLKESDDSNHIKSMCGSKSKYLKDHIKQILEKNPTKEWDRREKDIRRKRDIDNLEKLFKYLNIGIFYEFADSMPESFSKNTLFFSEKLYELFRSGYFHIYDKDLFEHLLTFYMAFDKIFKMTSNDYCSSSNGEIKFIFDRSTPEIEKRQIEVQDTIRKEVLNLRGGLNMLMDVVREKFIEIDIEKLNEIGLKELEKNK